MWGRGDFCHEHDFVNFSLFGVLRSSLIIRQIHCVTSIRSMDSTLKALQVRSMVTISNSLSLAARDHDSCSPISRAAFRQGGFSD